MLEYCNSQYSRLKCLEVSRIPDKIDQKDVEYTTLNICRKLEVEIDSSKTEHCHWLLSNGPKCFIIKFSKRKDANNSSLKEKPEGKEFDFTWHFFSNTFLTAASASITKCFGKNGKNY